MSEEQQVIPKDKSGNPLASVNLTKVSIKDGHGTTVEGAFWGEFST